MEVIILSLASSLLPVWTVCGRLYGPLQLPEEALTETL